MKQYLIGVSKEFSKINWLRFAVVIKYTFVVIFAAVLAGIVLGVMDNMFVKIIRYLTLNF